MIAAMAVKLEIGVISLIGLFASVFGDTATAAAVAGLFSTMNLVLNALILRKAQEAKGAAVEAGEKARSARRFLYNDEGRIVGSVPESRKGELRDFEPLLHDTPPEGHTLEQHRRRTADK